MGSLQAKIISHGFSFGFLVFVASQLAHIYEKQVWRKERISVYMKHSYEETEFNHLSLLSKLEGKQFSYSLKTIPMYHAVSGEKTHWFHNFIKDLLKDYQKIFIYKIL